MSGDLLEIAKAVLEESDQLTCRAMAEGVVSIAAELAALRRAWCLVASRELVYSSRQMPAGWVLRTHFGSTPAQALRAAGDEPGAAAVEAALKGGDRE